MNANIIGKAEKKIAKTITSRVIRLHNLHKKKKLTGTEQLEYRTALLLFDIKQENELMKTDINIKREREKKTVSLMIAIYCNGCHKTKNGLCPKCAELDTYARQRSDKCPFMETKIFCANCKVHCYRPEMREKIRAVMRYSGPRMIFHYPVMAMRHFISANCEKSSDAKKYFP